MVDLHTTFERTYFLFHVRGDNPCTLLVITPRLAPQHFHQVDTEWNKYTIENREAIHKNPIMCIQAFFLEKNIDTLIITPIEYTV